MCSRWRAFSGLIRKGTEVILSEGDARAEDVVS